MTPVLGKPLADQLASTLHSRFNVPPDGQFGAGTYMSKDLRTLLGEPVAARSRTATAATAT